MIACGKLILFASLKFFSFRPAIATSSTITTLDHSHFRHHHNNRRSCVEDISRGGFQNIIFEKSSKKCSSKVAKSGYSTSVSFQTRRHRSNRDYVSTCWMDPTTFGDMTSKDEFYQKNKKKSDLYGIKNSSWKSKEWNWGYGDGTGHECARICRHNYHTKQSRQALIDNMELLSVTDVIEIDWEEIKLIVGLMIQNLRRYESDRTVVDAFNEILNYLADAKRYESDGYDDDDDNVPLSLFVNDMKERYQLLKPSHDEVIQMNEIQWKAVDGTTDHQIPTNQRYQQNVVGLVLQQMKFVERGV